MIKCLECGREFETHITTHLKTHNLNKALYVKKYPGAVVVDPNKVLKGKDNPFYGKKHSKETKNKLSKKKLQQYQENPGLKKKVSETTKKGMRKPENWAKFKKGIENREPKPENLGKHSVKGYKPSEEEYSLKYSKERNKKISDARKKWWKDDKNVHIQRKILRQAKNNHLVTNVFETLLQKNEIIFEPEFKIENKFFDYYIPSEKILIEIDGEYWHSKGVEYECMNKVQKYVYHNDVLKNQLAKKHSYKLYRFWANDIKDGCVWSEVLDVCGGK